MRTVMIVAASLSFLAFGCSKPGQPDSVTVQGTWIGQDTGTTNIGAMIGSLVFQGTNVEFRGVNTNQWFKATFSLRENTKPKQLAAVFTGGPYAPDVGKTGHAIYKIEADTLTIRAHGPGDTNVPSRFEGPGVAISVFKRKPVPESRSGAAGK
jgi:uncharacterized protein (TIGR03067 family)